MKLRAKMCSDLKTLLEMRHKNVKLKETTCYEHVIMPVRDKGKPRMNFDQQ